MAASQFSFSFISLQKISMFAAGREIYFSDSFMSVKTLLFSMNWCCLFVYCSKAI